MNFNRGFTLVELLVVIAIVAILSSVLLVALSPSQDLAKDSANKAEANQFFLIYQQELVKGTTTAMCSLTEVDNLKSEIQGRLDAASDFACQPATGALASTAWAIAFKLHQDASLYWCVDSTGHKGERSTALGTATAC